MTSTDTVNITNRIDDMINYIQTGRILDAMTEFYDSNTSMQENSNEPTVGLEANIEREKQFLAQVKDFKAFNVLAQAVHGNTAFVESTLEFINTDNQLVKLEQVSVTRWQNGKIVHERFYYDSAK